MLLQQSHSQPCKTINNGVERNWPALRQPKREVFKDVRIEPITLPRSTIFTADGQELFSDTRMIAACQIAEYGIPKQSYRIVTINRSINITVYAADALTQRNPKLPPNRYHKRKLPMTWLCLTNSRGFLPSSVRLLGFHGLTVNQSFHGGPRKSLGVFCSWRLRMCPSDTPRLWPNKTSGLCIVRNFSRAYQR